MQPDTFVRGSRLLIVAGKGGVGKTTVASVLARFAASTGANVLVVDIEGKRGIASAFGKATLGYEESELQAPAPDQGRGAIRGRTLTPDDALVEYLEEHGLGRLSHRLRSSGTVEVIATAVPGMKDLLILAKVKQMLMAKQHDLIVLDAPASGHALRFLQSPTGMFDAVRTGPIHRQAEEVLAILRDPAMCQVMLVTIPEETPVNETIETAFALEESLGIALGPLVVNDVVDEVPAAAKTKPAEWTTAEFAAVKDTLAFDADRWAAQRTQRDRIRTQLPLPTIVLSQQPQVDMSEADYQALTAQFAAGVEALP